MDEEFEKRILKREYRQDTFVNKEFALPHTTNQLSQHIALPVRLITDQGLAETGGDGAIFLFIIPEEMTAEVESELFGLYDILFGLIEVGIDEFIELVPIQESFLKLVKSKGEGLHEWYVSIRSLHSFNLCTASSYQLETTKIFQSNI